MKKIYYHDYSHEGITFTYYYNEDGKVVLIQYHSSNKKDWLAKIEGFNPEKINKKSLFIEGQFNDYFTHKKALNLEYELLGGTDLERSVWQALTEIQWGETASYLEIAQKVNCSSARAVGNAVAKNPLSIVIPCHRVLHEGKNKVGKYGGGSEIKKALLEVEGLVLP